MSKETTNLIHIASKKQKRQAEACHKTHAPPRQRKHNPEEMVYRACIFTKNMPISSG